MSDPAGIARSLPELKLKLIKHNESGLKWQWEQLWLGSCARPGAVGWVRQMILLQTLLLLHVPLCFLPGLHLAHPDLCYTNVSAGAR